MTTGETPTNTVNNVTEVTSEEFKTPLSSRIRSQALESTGMGISVVLLPTTDRSGTTKTLSSQAFRKSWNSSLAALVGISTGIGICVALV